jgi:hypothetical protein
MFRNLILLACFVCAGSSSKDQAKGLKETETYEIDVYIKGKGYFVYTGPSFTEVIKIVQDYSLNKVTISQIINSYGQIFCKSDREARKFLKSIEPAQYCQNIAYLKRLLSTNLSPAERLKCKYLLTQWENMWFYLYTGIHLIWILEGIHLNYRDAFKAFDEAVQPSDEFAAMLADFQIDKLAVFNLRDLSKNIGGLRLSKLQDCREFIKKNHPHLLQKMDAMCAVCQTSQSVLIWILHGLHFDCERLFNEFNQVFIPNCAFAEMLEKFDLDHIGQFDLTNLPQNIRENQKQRLLACREFIENNHSDLLPKMDVMCEVCKA